MISKERRDAVDVAEAVLDGDLVGLARVSNRTVVWANGALHRIFGFADGEVVGRPTRIFFPDEQAYQKFAEAAYEALTSGAVYRSEAVQRRKDGSEVWLQFNISRVGGAEYEAIGAVIDITDRKKAEAALAAERALLEQRVTERTEQVRRLAGELEAAAMRERRRLAQDLHDDLGQTLAAMQIRLSSLRAHAREDVRSIAEELAGLLAEADRSTHSLAAQLAPPVLYELGLVPALEWLAEELQRTYGLRVRIESAGGTVDASQDVRSIVYRAVRELLINVARHANVGSATVRIECEAGRLLVTVRDEGCGFVTGPDAAPREGFGLAGIRERMSHIGGWLEVRSAAGAGTEAIVTAPLFSAGC